MKMPLVLFKPYRNIAEEFTREQVYVHDGRQTDAIYLSKIRPDNVVKVNYSDVGRFYYKSELDCLEEMLRASEFTTAIIKGHIKIIRARF